MMSIANVDRESGAEFDSLLERDWAGVIRHAGLTWRREPFAVRTGSGPTNMLNVVSRPDFFIPDIAVIFECKPTWDQAMAGADKWRQTAKVTGMPVMVTTGRPRWEPTAATRGIDSPPVLAAWLPDFPDVDLYGGCPAYLSRCPDCTAVGIFLDVIPWDAPVWGAWDAQVWEPRPFYWWSTCRHQGRPSRQDLHDGAYEHGIYPGAPRVDLAAWEAEEASLAAFRAQLRGLSQGS